MQRRWRKLTAIVIVLMLATVGCGPSPTKTLPTPGPATTAFPIGIFTMGGWGLEIKADGTYVVKLERMTESGSYTVTGNQVVFTGDYCTRLGVEKGTYAWNYDGKGLTFKALDDLCMDRLSRVDGSSWSKQP